VEVRIKNGEWERKLIKRTHIIRETTTTDYAIIATSEGKKKDQSMDFVGELEIDERERVQGEKRDTRGISTSKGLFGNSREKGWGGGLIPTWVRL